MGGRAIQTQMLPKVGPNMHQQIWILPLAQTGPLPDNARAHWWVWALGCRPRNVDSAGICLLIPRSLTSPARPPLVSGPWPQHQATPVQGICTGAALLSLYSLEKAFLCLVCFQGVRGAFPPSPPLTCPTRYWLPLRSHGSKTLKHRREYDTSARPSERYQSPHPHFKDDQYTLSYSALGQVLCLLTAFESKTLGKVKLDKLLNFNTITSHPISSSTEWR